MTALSSARDVALIDVSLRDGLQDEPCFVPLSGKLAILAALRAAKFQWIEATSFVHPAWVPQLADAEAFVGALPQGPRYSVLVLNRRGFDRAVAAFDRAGVARGSYDLTFVVSASPRHALANNNRSSDDSLRIFDELGSVAAASKVALTATVACAFGSPWDDEHVGPHDVARIVQRLQAAGPHRLTLADTVGLAQPERVDAVLSAVRQVNAATDLALHLHDRLGLAFDNVDVALQHGVRFFEGALAGLGGCPFVPDAPGNVDLLALHDFLAKRNITTGLDPVALARVPGVIRAALATAAPVAAPPAPQTVVQR
jgi:hydroxymethylglutaryl-CoA lyase